VLQAQRSNVGEEEAGLLDLAGRWRPDICLPELRRRPNLPAVGGGDGAVRLEADGPGGLASTRPSAIVLHRARTQACQNRRRKVPLRMLRCSAKSMR
jgi:hypothetical protein